MAPALFRYFSAAVAPHQVEDLVQEVFLRLVRKIASYDPAKGSLRMYSFGIAHFVRLEKFDQRSILALSEMNESDHAISTTADNERLNDIIDLRRAISNLPEDEKQVVLLQIDKDLSMTEIAEILQQPVGTVKSHLHRAKARLKTILEKEA